jgi:hypothetical protein
MHKSLSTAFWLVAGAALVPSVAAAQDAATEIRIRGNDTCTQGRSSYELTINGTLIGTYAGRAGCTCSVSGIYTIATINDPAALAAVGGAGCTSIQIRSTGPSQMLMQGVGVDIDRQASGTESVCIRGNCSVNGGVCTTGYQWFAAGASSVSSPSDIDADGICDGDDPDIDGDGVANAADNCPTAANPGQADTDHNNIGDACQPTLATVPWLGDPDQPHQVYSGGALVLQGAYYHPADGAPVALASAEWNPGDGSGPQAVSVANPLVLELTHTFNGAVGQPFSATLTVVDTAGVTYTDNFRVVIQPDTLDVRTNMAIDKGLWYLHKQQTITGDMGSWSGRGGNERTAGTSSSVQAFEINGHRQAGDALEDPYVHTTRRGLNYILSQLTVTNVAGAADVNGNGRGLSSPSSQVYTGGQIVDAFVASGTPDTVASIGNAAGSTYGEIVQDLLDAYAGGMSRASGGWIYSWGQAGIDSSSSQWAAIGDLAAQSWGKALPQFVRDDNWNNGIPRLQTMNGTGAGNDGRCGYRNTGPHEGGIANTPSCMVMMLMDGQVKTHHRYEAAGAWFDRNWGSSYHMGYMYGMFALTKAMRLAREHFDNDGDGVNDDLDGDGIADTRAAPIDLLAGTRDWYTAYADYLVRSGGAQAQQADGHWRKRRGWEDDHLTTAWAIIILSPTVFELSPIARCTADPLIDGTAEIGGNVTFSSGNSSHQDPDVAIVGYEWDFQDGAAAGTADANHAFDAVGIYNVTLTVTDENGLRDSTTCPVDVRNSDIPPNANTGGPYQFCDGDAQMILDGSSSTDLDTQVVSWTWDLSNPVGDGTADAQGVTTNIAGVFPGVGTYDIALTVTDVDDPAPNTNTEFTQVVIVPFDDPSCNQAPLAIATPDAEMFECAGPAGTSVTLDGSTSSDPDGDVLTYSWDPALGLADANAAVTTGLFATGDHGFTLTVDDGHGASATDDASFTVIDSLAPVMSCGDALAECAGDRTDAAPTGTALDQCDGELATSADTAGPFGLGDTLVTFSATDATGQASACTAVVTVVDTTAPEIECFGGQAECAGAATDIALSAASTDICDGLVDITSANPGAFALGTTEVTFTGTDDSGNASACVATATVVDTTAPGIDCTSGQAECTGAATAVALSAASADLCDSSVDVTSANPGVFALGATVVAFTGTDDSGNATSCDATATVVDTTAPALTCAVDVTVEADAACIGHADPQASAADICDAAPAISRDGSTEWALGATTVNHTAIDGSGNSTACQSTVTVVDAIAPTADAGADQTLAATAACAAEVTLNGSAGDNCGVISYQWTEGGAVIGDTAELSTAMQGVGDHTLTLTACDAAGNCTSDDVVVSVPTSMMACFGVTKVNLKLTKQHENHGHHGRRHHDDDHHGRRHHDDDDDDDDHHGERADGHLHIDGRFSLNDCSELDFAAIGASLTVDGEVFTVPAGGFEPVGHSGKFRYRLRTRAHHDLEWTLEINTRKGEWSFKSKHHNTDPLSPADGLDTELMLGDQFGQETVAVEGKGRHLKEWKYRAHKHSVCPSEHHHGHHGHQCHGHHGEGHDGRHDRDDRDDHADEDGDADEDHEGRHDRRDNHRDDRNDRNDRNERRRR